MNEQEVMKQLRELIDDRNSFIGQEVTEDDFYSKDKEALETIIAMYENTKRELLHRDELLLENYKTMDKRNELISEQKAQISSLEEKVKDMPEKKSNATNDFSGGIIPTLAEALGGKTKADYQVIESKYYILIRYLQVHYKENMSLSADDARKILKAVEGVNIKVGGKDNG